ncbi:MAG: hypothetical protein Kow0089_20200 [Desulfobulbaceae bacterium]
MNMEMRRSRRHNDFIAISVEARSNAGKERLAGPFAGRIINISKYGACLLMSLGVLESYDVYRSTCRNNSRHLEIQGPFPSGTTTFTLHGRPVWMDPFMLDDLRAFKMGVEFLTEADCSLAERIIEDITPGSIEDIFAADEEE